MLNDARVPSTVASAEEQTARISEFLSASIGQTSIEAVENTEYSVEDIYSIDGMRISTLRKGINIVQMQDSKGNIISRKVMR